MAVDKLKHVSNEELIEKYNDIGKKRLEHGDYSLTIEEIDVISAVSKRKLYKAIIAVSKM